MNSLSKNWIQNGLQKSVALLALSCSACTSLSPSSRTAQIDERPVHAVYQESVKNQKAPRSARAQDASVAPAEAQAAMPPQVRRDPALQQIAYTDAPAYGSVVPQSHQAEWCPPACPPYAYQPYGNACPPEVRLPAAGDNPLAQGMVACEVCNVPSIEKYPEEYLCDGGDRDQPVHYDSFSRIGLDTEDTVLEFTDRSGKQVTKPSNRVCVYAPRFASVRTVSAPHEGQGKSEIGGVQHMASTKGMHTRLKPSNEVKREMLGGVAVRSRASGLETDVVLDSVWQLRRLSSEEKVINLHQSLAFVQFGQINDTESAMLKLGILAAMQWTRDEYPVISSKTDSAMEGHFEQSVATITCIEEKEEAENLRIIKLADKKTAAVGDEIQFTIRYDNLGGREVHHIRIVDNLTPRLQYIDDSATSDRAGRLILQDNGEGSNVLIWEIDEPLPGKAGGIVTFKTRVR